MTTTNHVVGRQAGEAAGAANTLGLDTAAQLVRDAWGAGDVFTEQTRLRSSETIERFTRRAARQGARVVADLTAAMCLSFVMAPTEAARPPEITTQHARRTALRMFFRTLRELGLADGDPTLDLTLPARTSTAARPLTDEEVALCRFASRLGQAGSGSLQRAVCWALAETTAVTSEITEVRIADLDDSVRPRWVRLPGTRRVRERLGELSEWGTHVVARQVEMLTARRAPTSTLLTYRGQGVPGQHVAQAAVCNALGEILRRGGFSDEPDVRPASVRNWAGRSLFDGGMPIEHVAVRMGARSLDAVAEDIGLVWGPE